MLGKPVIETGATVVTAVSLRELNYIDARIGLLLPDAARSELGAGGDPLGAESRQSKYCGWRPSWATPPRLNVTYKAVRQYRKHCVLVKYR